MTPADPDSPRRGPWRLTLPDGVAIRQGEYHCFEEYHSYQRTVMPVISISGDDVHCWGSAVSIGAGWFVTARHVVADFLNSVNSRGVDPTLYVIWETDTRLATGENNFLGTPLPVLARDLHQDPGVDLATLSVAFPSAAVPEVIPVQLDLRMPKLSEAVVVVGYPHLNGTLHRDPDGTLAIQWERTIAVGLGEVREQQCERVDRAVRGGPGFVTDAPTPPGTSGGAVLDWQGNCLGFVSSSFEPTPEHPHWNSFISLLGPVLELRVLNLKVGQRDATDVPDVQIAKLIADGDLDLEWNDTSFDVDPQTRRGFYNPT